MKPIYQILGLLVAMALLVGCKSTNNTTQPVYPDDLSAFGLDTSKIEVIYFHNKQRCANCVAVEELTGKVVSGMDSSMIRFAHYAIGSNEVAALEDTLQIAGPTVLLFHRGEVINLTTSAYLFARVKPEKYRADLEKAIQELK